MSSLDPKSLDYDPDQYVEKSMIPSIDWSSTPGKQREYERDALRALAAQIEREHGLEYLRVGFTESAAVYDGYGIPLRRDASMWRGPFTAKECRAYLYGMQHALNPTRAPV